MAAAPVITVVKPAFPTAMQRVIGGIPSQPNLLSKQPFAIKSPPLLRSVWPTTPGERVLVLETLASTRPSRCQSRSDGMVFTEIGRAVKTRPQTLRAGVNA
ncbi:MAG: hypothetical protein M2R45_02378 [Verrucomicrobia subdivision 3 bacterium]|nr:hypothetical protein [Limisphaerales bacterium]MCS1414929.1 hypothetical protein [Limisphaerales bacterium]